MTDPKAMTLTKARIMDEIQNKLSFSRKRSVEVVETLLEIMKRSMENGEDVLISGFGRFCVKQKKERSVCPLANAPRQSKPRSLTRELILIRQCPPAQNSDISRRIPRSVRRPNAIAIGGIGKKFRIGIRKARRHPHLNKICTTRSLAPFNSVFGNVRIRAGRPRKVNLRIRNDGGDKACRLCKCRSTLLDNR